MSAKALSKRLHEAEAKALDAAFARIAVLWGLGLDKHSDEALPLCKRVARLHMARGGSLEALLQRLPRDMTAAIRAELRRRFAEEDAA